MAVTGKIPLEGVAIAFKSHLECDFADAPLTANDSPEVETSGPLTERSRRPAGYVRRLANADGFGCVIRP